MLCHFSLISFQMMTPYLFAIWDYELKYNFQQFCVLSLKKLCLSLFHFIRLGTPIIAFHLGFHFHKRIAQSLSAHRYYMCQIQTTFFQMRKAVESKISTTFFIPNSRLNLSTSDSVCWSQKTLSLNTIFCPSSAIFLLFEKVQVFIIPDGQNVCLSRFRL